MYRKDWIQEAADEIGDLPQGTPRKAVNEILERLCPFKKNTAYIEVGELCTKLDEIQRSLNYLRNQ